MGAVAIAVLVAVQRLPSITEVFDTILEGFKSMLLPLGTVVAGFMLKEVNDQLGLAPYVIGVVQPLMTPEFLPLVTFLTIALIAFATGSFWGIIVVAMPIVIPLAEAVNADLSLVKCWPFVYLNMGNTYSTNHLAYNTRIIRGVELSIKIQQITYIFQS